MQSASYLLGQLPAEPALQLRHGDYAVPVPEKGGAGGGRWVLSERGALAPGPCGSALLVALGSGRAWPRTAAPTVALTASTHLAWPFMASH